MVRFLWDAHNCEDSPADSAVQLGVSFAYVERWQDDLEQLWFLGMQILNSLIKPVRSDRLHLIKVAIFSLQKLSWLVWSVAAVCHLIFSTLVRDYINVFKF